jgi:calcineurin-like phosphoesterase family protein
MNTIFFTSDPHLGHKNIHKFRNFVSSPEENTELFLEQWSKHIHKRAIVYLLGDVAFDKDSLDKLKGLPGKKILIKGNHDDFVSTREQSEVFSEIHGMLSYKRMWLTHCPVHPHEIRGKKVNVHGHVHWKSIQRRNWFFRKVQDPRYINVCVDALWDRNKTCFISLDEIREHINKHNL